MTPPILAALTHPSSGDGAVPARILEAVQPLLDHRVWVLDGVEPTDLLGLWDDAPLVLLVTTAIDSEPAGTLHRVDLVAAAAEAALLPRPRPMVGIGEVLTVARALEQAPQRVVLLTVSIESGHLLASGDPVSPAVAAAVAPAGQVIVAEFGPALSSLAAAG